MGFPQIASVGFSAEAVDTNIHNVVMPAGIVPGDLLLLIAGWDGNVQMASTPAGWTFKRKVNYNGLVSHSIYEKVADGTEIDFTYNSIRYNSDNKQVYEESVNHVIRVTGWDGVTSPNHYAAIVPIGKVFRSTGAGNSATWGVDNNSFLNFYHMNAYDGRTGEAVTYPPGSIGHRTGNSGGGAGSVGFGMAITENSVSTMPYYSGQAIFTTNHYAEMVRGQIIIRGT